jgi:hypothetical protein
MNDSGHDDRRPDDDALMAMVARMLARVDPPPPTLPGEALLTWRSLDADLAELLGDDAALGPRFCS